MAPSPLTITRAIKNVRRRKDEDSPANSIASTAEDGDEGRRGLRSSIDSAVDKIKILPPRRKRTQQQRDQTQQLAGLDGAERGRSVGGRETLADSYDANASEQSLGRWSAERKQSSLLTQESDTDSLNTPSSIPPQAGFLTLSSSTSAQTSASNAQEIGPALTKPESNTATLENQNLSPGLNRPTRSRSPAGRFKDVFKNSSAPTRRATSPNPSPDRDGGGGGGGIGGIFASRRESASSSRRNSRIPEDVPPVPPLPLTPERPQSAKVNTPSQRILTSSSSPSLAPVTLVTPPTPTNPSSEFALNDTPYDSNPNITTSPSGHMISHRRSRSGPSNHPPSKLSKAQTAPLSPTLEESGVSPGDKNQGQTGFFSTVISAAQNAATTFGNSIANTSLGQGGNRSRSATQTSESERESEKESGEEVISTFIAPSGKTGSDFGDQPTIRPAVETLGLGDLSLSHLGISDPGPLENGSSTFPSMSDSPMDPQFREDRFRNQRNFTSLVDEASNPGTPTRTNGSGIHSERVAGDNFSTPTAEDPHTNGKPRSTYEQSIDGDQTPPNTANNGTSSGVKRSGSVRSRVGAVGRRKRGSSTTTGGTIAAAIGATNAALGAQSSVPRLTGFAVAPKKRNRDFHQLFRSVPEDDYLIEDYSAALQREILLHGRLYVSEGHICFNANIFGWVTTLVISFDEVVSLEKKSTAVVFPNAIVISTLHARNVFASFVSRDSTYDLLVGIWKISHPNLKSSLNGVTLGDGLGGDKTVKAESQSSDVSESDDEADEVYDEDDEIDGGADSFIDAGEGSLTGSEIGGDPEKKSLSRKPSGLPSANSAVDPSASSDVKTKQLGLDGALSTSDFPGPAAHAPTSCADQTSHYEKVIKDDIIQAPLGKVYSLVFGPGSGPFMSKWLLEDQKVLDLQMDENAKQGLSEGKRTRTFSYIKPLNASIGPKQTKCIITEVMDALDLERAVSVTCTTQTPDVPSGNVFSTKTKYCFMWAEGNATRIIINCTIEWTGKSWLKGPIEKGANDGQVSYAKDLFDALRGTISKTRTGSSGLKGKGKGRRRKGTQDSTVRSAGRSRDAGAVSYESTPTKASWGPLEPVREIASSIVEIIKSIIPVNVALGVLFTVIILVLWFGSSYTRTSVAAGPPTHATLGVPGRFSGYEDLWRQEEGELWDWLEERVGMGGISLSLSSKGNDAGLDEARKQRLGAIRGRGVESKLEKDKMSEREVDDAIRVTEERLQALKQVVKKRRAERNNDVPPQDTEAVAAKPEL